MAEVEKVTLILSDSILARISVSYRHHSTYVAFKKDGTGYTQLHHPPPKQANVYLDPNKAFGAIHQLSFSGWKMEDSLTPFHLSKIQQQIKISGGDVFEIYLVIGINDLRYIILD
jgi:hypothetical protein